MGESYAGNSGSHNPRANAVDTTNGAGGHNIQMFVIAPDGTVLHCLPGYWNPEDLNTELKLALKLNDLYNNKALSTKDRNLQFARLQVEHVRSHSAEMVARSELQGFDMKHEAHNPKSDFLRPEFANERACLAGEHWGPEAHLAFKTTDTVMHERMARRAFMQYSSFDVAAYCDYGTTTYDKHEDRLDESGHVLAGTEEAPFVAIKNHKSIAAALQQLAVKKVTRASLPHRKDFVQTYGVLRAR